MDPETLLWAKDHVWSAEKRVLKNGTINFYFMTRIEGKDVLLHRLIMNAPKDKIVDHEDHNTLNNLRTNLRLCTHSGNAANKVPRGQYKGIFWSKQKNKWQAEITKDYKLKHLGTFDTPEEAAKAYNTAAEQIHGEFAYLNTVE